MASLPEKGRLEEHPLPRLLLELNSERFGGALTLSRDRVGKRFLFQEGIPVFAESNLASESLGVQLMDAGRIDRSEFNRTGAYIEEHGCKEGTALLALKLLEPRDLFDALKDQVRIRIVECFGWPHGEFFLDASCPPPADAQPFRADVYALLQEGLEAHWSNERILTDLGPQMDLFPRRSKRFDHVTARLHRDSALEAVLEAIDGTRNLWRVVQAASTPRSLAAAWVLDAAQALDYDEDAPDLGASAAPRNVEIVVDDKPRAASAARPSKAGPGVSPRRHGAQLDALLREIEAKHEQLAESDYYQLLGIADEATAAEVKRAYLQAAKTYHPDALARSGLDTEARAKANQVFARIGKAHAVLTDPARRRDYDVVRGSRDTDLDAERLAQAEGLYRKGEILLRQGNFRGALEFLKPAAELWPDECAYQSALGWALYKKMPSEPEAAREHLEAATRLDPGDAVTQSRLSFVLRSLGDEVAADEAAARSESLGG